MDEENEVEMNKTMWLVLRKTKPINNTLQHFYSESQAQEIKLKDIIKFGRVNFKISALKSSQLSIEANNDPKILQSENQNMNTQFNNDKSQISHSMINHTDMNLLEGNNNQSTLIQVA